MELFILFFTFFKIGLFTIGGGYAMIPMIEQEIVEKLGWITEEQLLDYIGIAECTPGPFAVNTATFVGNSIGGVWGGIIATAGVCLPSLVIILIVAAILEKFMQTKGVQGFFFGVRPVVAGLIASSALTIALGIVLPQLDLTYFGSLQSEVDWVSLLLIVVFFGASFLAWKGRDGKRHRIHPLWILLFSAVVGLIVFGLFEL